MSDPAADMSTDAAWEEWGKSDPYFGVITDPRFRQTALDEHAKRDFFATGKGHVDYLIGRIKERFDPGFSPRNILDFGCGVGRLLIPFSPLAQQVVGLDVSQSMLQEARRNCDALNLRNVQLLVSDDQLSALTDSYDLVHSCIVFQHIPFSRGIVIFTALLRHLRPGGIGAIHLVYSKIHFADTHGVAPIGPHPPVAPEAPPSVDPDPVIQMNSYNINPILFALQSAGIRDFYTDFTDHGGELGIFLFFKMPLA